MRQSSCALGRVSNKHRSKIGFKYLMRDGGTQLLLVDDLLLRERFDADAHRPASPIFMPI